MRSDLREDLSTEEQDQLPLDDFESILIAAERLDGFKVQVSRCPFLEENRLGLFGFLVAQEQASFDRGFHLSGDGLVQAPHFPSLLFRSSGCHSRDSTMCRPHFQSRGTRHSNYRAAS